MCIEDIGSGYGFQIYITFCKKIYKSVILTAVYTETNLKVLFALFNPAFYRDDYDDDVDGDDKMIMFIIAMAMIIMIMMIVMMII